MEGIDGSAAMVILESAEAAGSSHMHREVSYAASEGKRIVRLILPGLSAGSGPVCPALPTDSPVVECGEEMADCLPDLLRLVSPPVRPKHRAMVVLLASVVLPASAILLLGLCDRATGWPERLRFVEIPPGTFLMGSPDDEAFRWQGEGPQVEVRVEGFEIMTTEVTQDMWTRVMGTTREDLVRAAGMEDIDIYLPQERRGELPVVMVSWRDATAFAEELCRLDTLHVYRLPTEAEWEYACRAGATGAVYGEDESLSVDDVSWHFGNSGNHLHPAGTLAPNAWGLYDMLGNVSEWCLDAWREDHTGSPGLASETVPGRIDFRPERGSGFISSYRLHRCAFRDVAREDLTYHALGFRVARFPR
jgi:formylglycine-generating enzyme required for sulfatase activity